MCPYLTNLVLSGLYIGCIGGILLNIPTAHSAKCRYSLSMISIGLIIMCPIPEQQCKLSAVSLLPFFGCPWYFISDISDVSCRKFSGLLLCICKSSRTSVPALCGKGNGETVFKKKGWEWKVMQIFCGDKRGVGVAWKQSASLQLWRKTELDGVECVLFVYKLKTE